ncbi:nucleotide sugar dehydrogenase [Pedobacter sp. KLB.chiD]|uniref:nucleotide sugar dehydrogenase n=1 Tax=Pedobacter sp. KLB.chiD TaxID=3387402 RepID=UPI003999829C
MDQKKIVVVGLGYVGLPLAIEFARKYAVIGFDIDTNRIAELNNGFDRTKEVSKACLDGILRAKNHLSFAEAAIQANGLADELSAMELPGEGSIIFSSSIEEIRDAEIFIVTVPTPIDEFKKPDLHPLLKASETVGKVLKKGDIVIYESTVYPGCTEEDCVPVLEANSRLKFNEDFYCGYSPERINPGDKINTLTKIKKVTSGSTPEIAREVNALYASIIAAGTHLAPSIKVAEASKAIENAQRDINISFVNELALIFDRIGIDTTDVIEAASTKWNFLPYKPGLVGGHCIGVDPYYLAHKAESFGYHPQVILSGRRVNDSMGGFVVNKVLKLMIKKELLIKNAKCLILGFTFKENCPDVRNTRVIDIYMELVQFGLSVDVYDPWANADEVYSEYGVKIMNNLHHEGNYDAIILTVAHQQFMKLDVEQLKNQNGVIFDAKSVIDRNLVDGRL